MNLPSFNLEKITSGAFQCHHVFLLPICSPLFSQVSFIWYFMIWVGNSSDSEQGYTSFWQFVPSRLSSWVVPSQPLWRMMVKVYLFSTPHGWRLFQPINKTNLTFTGLLMPWRDKHMGWLPAGCRDQPKSFQKIAQGSLMYEESFIAILITK